MFPQSKGGPHGLEVCVLHTQWCLGRDQSSPQVSYLVPLYVETDLCHPYLIVGAAHCEDIAPALGTPITTMASDKSSNPLK